MSKDSAYTALFYFLFLLFFPSVLNNISLLISNFFILLAIRRTVSLHSLKASKEKIFDASIWVFIAALFHFWSILFIVLIFISVLFHVARDYRNWFLPLLAFCAVAIIFVLSALYFHTHWIDRLFSQSMVDFRLNYFTNNYQNVALSIYATIGLFFVISLLLSMSNRPLILHPTYKKILSADYYRHCCFRHFTQQIKRPFDIYLCAVGHDHHHAYRVTSAEMAARSSVGIINSLRIFCVLFAVIICCHTPNRPRRPNRERYNFWHSKFRLK